MSLLQFRFFFVKSDLQQAYNNNLIKIIMDLIALKYIGIGLLSIGMAGAALGIGNIFNSFFSSVARNPSEVSKFKAFVFIGAAFVELIAILALVLAILILNHQ